MLLGPFSIVRRKHLQSFQEMVCVFASLFESLLFIVIAISKDVDLNVATIIKAISSITRMYFQMRLPMGPVLEGIAGQPLCQKLANLLMEVLAAAMPET